MSKKCPWCKVDVYLTEIKNWWKCPECQTEFPGRAFPKESTLFDRVTESPETLAKRSVYCLSSDLCRTNDGKFTVKRSWKSPFIDRCYETREEAIFATVARLKEVAKLDEVDNE